MDADSNEGFTERLCEQVANFSIADDEVSLAWGRHALLDWLGVTIAGSREESGRIAADYVRDEGAAGLSTVIGHQVGTLAHQAALANGIAAHALDFDDSSLTLGGHPSAPIIAATLAMAERDGKTAVELIEAVAAGFHAQAHIATATGLWGYEHGFHTTGTFGTFGAAAACGRLAGVDAATMERALGLAATQAAGLKASFGTMGKHLNAAKGAVNGLLAVDLARRGFTGPAAAIETKQGFAWTYSDKLDGTAAFAELAGKPAIRSISFKYHACCHLTHSAIEGALRLRQQHGFAADDLVGVELDVAPASLDVCSIADPKTGLEGKFSVAYATSLALSGRSTGPDSFTDAMVREPALVTLRERINLVPIEGQQPSDPVRVTVTLRDGATHSTAVVGIHSGGDELADQWAKLVHKFTSLAAPVIGAERASATVEAVADLENHKSLTDIVRVGPVTPHSM